MWTFFDVLSLLNLPHNTRPYGIKDGSPGEEYFMSMNTTGGIIFLYIWWGHDIKNIDLGISVLWRKRLKESQWRFR